MLGHTCLLPIPRGGAKDKHMLARFLPTNRDDDELYGVRSKIIHVLHTLDSVKYYISLIFGSVAVG